LLVRLFADLQKLSESDREKKPSERALRVQELVTSERDYIEDIRIVVAQFKVPIVNNSLLPESACKEVFGNIEQMLQINVQMYQAFDRVCGKPPVC
jgi:hypothetical protein